MNFCDVCIFNFFIGDAHPALTWLTARFLVPYLLILAWIFVCKHNLVFGWHALFIKCSPWITHLFLSQPSEWIRILTAIGLFQVLASHQTSTRIWVFSPHASRHAVGLVITGNAARNTASCHALDHARRLQTLRLRSVMLDVLGWFMDVFYGTGSFALNFSKACLNGAVVNGRLEAAVSFHF